MNQLISALCTLGIVILAILVTTRAISLDDALKAVGKIFLILLILSFAIYLFVPPVLAAIHALTVFLKAVIPWLLVAVSVGLLLMLILRMRQSRFSKNNSRDGGDE